ncbi:MAG TPA: GNAT family N-acetyltransferase [Anaerolineae bacterium]|nr:GNAT family N-acetyltransferase [Anaerolineae bacterium]
MALEINTLTTTDLFKDLASEWNAILHNSAADTPFLTLEWQQTWWDCLAEGELFVITVRDSGALIGIAPLFLVSKPFKDNEEPRRLLRLIGGVDASDYLDLIAVRDREREVIDAMLSALAKSDRWDVLDLYNVPEASLARSVLPALAAPRQWKMIDEPQVVCPIIPLPISFEEYLDSLDKKERHELRRKLRRAENAEGVTWYAVTAQDHEHDLTEAAESFINLMMQSRSDKSDFMTAAMRRFFHSMIRAMHAGGFLHLSFLEVEGVKAATYLCFDYGSRRLVFNSGLDTTQFQSLSAGIVLAARLIEESIQRGYTEFDFLRGNEDYKYRLGAKDTYIYHVAIER